MTFKKPTQTLIALCTAVLALGCNTEERTTTTGSTPSETILSQTDSTSAILYSARLNSVFTNALSSENVMAGRAFLESEGYTYVDTNSLILIRRRSVRGSSAQAESAFLPDENRTLDPGSTVRVDTIFWLAFENPTHDMANHTAIISTHDRSSNITLLVELDVSTEQPGLIREGKIVNGQYTPGDVGTEGWLACMGAGLAGTAAGCLMTNCAYAHCAAGGSVGTLVACSFGWAFGS